MNKLKSLYYSFLIGFFTFIPNRLVLAEDGEGGITFNASSEGKGKVTSGAQSIEQMENNFIDKMKTGIAIATALAFIILTAYGILRAVRLATQSEYVHERRNNIMGILFVFIAAALCGATSIICGIFTTLLQ